MKRVHFFFFLSLFFSVRFRWEKGVDITIREPFSSARVPTRNNDGAFGIRNCANCSFSFGDYRRDTRGGITTTSFSRKKMKRTNLSGRSDPFAATWCVFVLSCRSFWFLFTFLSILLVQKKKRDFIPRLLYFFPFYLVHFLLLVRP